MEPSDEIAELADLYHRTGGIPAIEGQIAHAQGEGDWTALNKWHRVRLRVQRMQQAELHAVQIATRLGTISGVLPDNPLQSAL